jgi:hypothetical protein
MQPTPVALPQGTSKELMPARFADGQPTEPLLFEQDTLRFRRERRKRSKSIGRLRRAARNVGPVTIVFNNAKRAEFPQPVQRI